ncbi:MAG: HPr family phosphocarrier protein [Spirochaetes bacterium]|jgi:phosphocarrier protein|nr:HPr family phosphocarrier protein [Spirochaetota bacterium]
MTEEGVLVKSDAGVHARPAMMLVKEAMKFPCEIFLIKDKMEANGKSIMSVLGLAITQGSKIIVRAEGGQEKEAVSRIVSLFNTDFKVNE